MRKKAERAQLVNILFAQWAHEELPTSLTLPLMFTHGNIQEIQGRAGDVSAGVKDGINKKDTGKFIRRKDFISSTAQRASWF